MQPLHNATAKRPRKRFIGKSQSPNSVIVPPGKRLRYDAIQPATANWIVVESAPARHSGAIDGPSESRPYLSFIG